MLIWQLKAASFPLIGQPVPTSSCVSHWVSALHVLMTRVPPLPNSVDVTSGRNAGVIPSVKASTTVFI